MGLNNKHPDELRARVIKLAQSGMCYSDIAWQTNLQAKQIHSIVHYARRCGTTIPHYNPGIPKLSLRVFLPALLTAEIRKIAAKRDETPEDLVRQIVGFVVNDNLVDAVLDDGGSNG